MVLGMSDPVDLEARLDRLEAITLSLRDQVEQQHDTIQSLSIDVARLQRAVISGSGEVLAALVDLRSHLVDLSLDGYYPTRAPPPPLPRG